MVTDVGGARELILDDSYGTIIRSMASDEVVSALCRLFDDRSCFLFSLETLGRLLKIDITGMPLLWMSRRRFVFAK